MQDKATDPARCERDRCGGSQIDRTVGATVGGGSDDRAWVQASRRGGGDENYASGPVEMAADAGVHRGASPPARAAGAATAGGAALIAGSQLLFENLEERRPGIGIWIVDFRPIQNP